MTDSQKNTDVPLPPLVWIGNSLHFRYRNEITLHLPRNQENQDIETIK